MPVDKEQELSYLQLSLQPKQVLELLAESYASNALEAYSISRRITSRKEPSDVPELEVLEPHEYAEIERFD